MSGIGVLTPTQAWELLQSEPRSTLVDVRTSMEFEYVGHPPGAAHVPWQESPHWQIDPRFTDKVRAMLRERYGSEVDIEQLPVLTLCRSGMRSHAAAETLAEAGFRKVYNIAEGFEGDRDGEKHRGTINGWRYHNLPWEQG